MEGIIYIAILAVVSVFAINVIFTAVKSYNNLIITRNINNAASNFLERVSREIRFATAVNASQSVFNAHPGKLFLNTINQDTEAETALEFYLDGPALVASSTEGVKYLTSASTAIASLIFREVNAATTSAIKIEIEIASTKDNFQKSEKFYLTAALRQ